MPFKLTNTPALKQKLINNIFKNILNKYIIIYLNNILVYSGKALKDYIKKVYKILRHFNKKNLKLKPEKYYFHQKKVNFLGYIIGRDKVRINPQKITLIKEWLKPTNIIKI